MSWDSYITDNLMAPIDEAGTTLTCAALVGQDGGVWAKSDHFPDITADEVATILAAMTDVSIGAVNVAGAKYLKIAGDDTLLRARKDKAGFIAKKTNQAIVFGFYHEPTTTAPICNKIVESLGDYLINMGY